MIPGPYTPFSCTGQHRGQKINTGIYIDIPKSIRLHSVLVHATLVENTIDLTLHHRDTFNKILQYSNQRAQSVPGSDHLPSHYVLDANNTAMKSGRVSVDIDVPCSCPPQSGSGCGGRNTTSHTSTNQGNYFGTTHNKSVMSDQNMFVVPVFWGVCHNPHALIGFTYTLSY